MVQEAARAPFPQLVEERVFTPLGMKHSTFQPTVAMTFPLAIGHRGARGEAPAVVRPMAEDTRHWPAGYIYTSANDLARLAIALLHGDKVFHDLMTPRDGEPRATCRESDRDSIGKRLTYRPAGHL
jgi:CubicO group peptidase (beta-lactamase class C family)